MGLRAERIGTAEHQRKILSHSFWGGSSGQA